MRKDSLKKFCSPTKNIAYGIYRYNISTAEINKLKNIINGWYAKGIRFDSAFSLASDDKMYCSEMICKAVKEATGKRIFIQPTQLNAVEAGFLTAYTHLPFYYTNKLRIVPIDALYVNPFCHLIKKYKY
jgi:Permuted papain-like amidase enzyme, YaeF/YiiX, C92 family